MTIKNRSKLQILSIPFSIISIAIVALCYYLLQFVDLIVNGDLYEFGLVFSYDWANQYWNYSTLIKDSIFISILLLSIVIFSTIILIISKKNIFKIITSFIISVIIFFLILSFFSLTRLDFTVNNSLYAYGLQFSYDWASTFWSNIITIYGLFVAATMIEVISILIILNSESWFSSGVKSLLNFNSLLLVVGILIIFSSINFNSSILVFIGLGCIFWGAILFYVRSEAYIKQELLLATTKSTLAGLRQMLLELDYKGTPIYLPPKYLKDFESSKVFISKTSKFILPSEDQIQDKDTVIINNPKALLITPPGFDLSKLFEEKLVTNFTQKDLSFIQANLQKLIVEELEIAQNIQMEILDNLIHITIGKSVYQNMGTLSSAIACILAKASGKLVLIKNRTTTQDAQIIELDYLLLDSPVS